jgi:hypothetical protein
VEGASTHPAWRSPPWWWTYFYIILAGCVEIDQNKTHSRSHPHQHQLRT